MAKGVGLGGSVRAGRCVADGAGDVAEGDMTTGDGAVVAACPPGSEGLALGTAAAVQPEITNPSTRAAGARNQVRGMVNHSLTGYESIGGGAWGGAARSGSRR